MIAFVLSGGASLGAMQVGMLEALFERGVRPGLIVGTSAGALNGAFIASRAPVPSTAEELASVWRGIRRSDVFPVRPLTGLLGLLGRASHLVPLHGLHGLLAEHVEFELLEQSPIPLHVVAADVATGAEVRLSSGPAADAVLASAAIPGVFRPVEIGGRLLMDGGVANNAPITHALELGADEIYVLPTGYTCALPEPPRGALAMALHAMTILVAQRLVREIAALRDQARLVVLPPPCPVTVQPIDFSRASELIDGARDGARAFLGTSGVDPTLPAVALTAHTHAEAASVAPPGTPLAPVRS